MSNRTVEATLKVSSRLGSMAALTTVQQKMAAVNGQAEAYNRIGDRNYQMMLTRMSAYAGLTAVGVGYAIKETYSHYAEMERRLNRIAVNAGEGKTATADMIKTINQASRDYAMSQVDVAAGLETLVASGRSAKDAMTFLPAVVATAQAAGAQVTDMATSADALSTSFGIAGDRMQSAFDILVEGGKQGKFELKDMAQYLPSMAPAFAALGYQGTDAIAKLAAMLQVVRMRTGSASEAATALDNVFQKMESQETVNKFAKFGVNLRKEMARARKEGKDLVEVFLDLTRKATGGDLSKLPQLFTDTEFQKGMRALLMGKDAMNGFVAALRNADGSTLRALGQVLDDNQAKIDRMKASWEEFKLALGGAVAPAIGGALDAMSEGIDANQAIAKALKNRGMDYWEIQAWFTNHESDIKGKRAMAAEGGWRSPQGRLAAKGKMDVSPELPSRRQDQPAIEPTSAPPAKHKGKKGKLVAIEDLVIPAEGPLPPARPADPNAIEIPGELRYDRFLPLGKGQVEQIDRDEQKRFEKLSREGKRAALEAAARKQPSGDAAYDEFLAAASGKFPAAHDRAGQSIRDAAEAINQAGQDGGATFADMLRGVGRDTGNDAASAFEAGIVGLGQKLGADIAAAIAARVGSLNINVNTHVSGPSMSGVNADVGRSNGGVRLSGRV